MFWIVTLGLCSMAETLYYLAHGKFPPTVAIFQTAAGALLAIYGGYQQKKSDRSSALLEKSQQKVEELVRDLAMNAAERDYRDALDSRALGDDSRAGLEWKRIQGKITHDSYLQYQADFPDSQYRAEAEKRVEVIAQWHRVNHDDPFDIHAYLQTPLFEALRKHAEVTLREAVKRCQREARAEFWRQVGIPFHVLIPVIPLVYPLFFGALASVYILSGQAFLMPLRELVEEFLRSAIADWSALPYYEHIRPAAEWLVLNVEQIVRVALAVGIGIVAFYLLSALVRAIVKAWIEPRATAIHSYIDYGTFETYKDLV